MKGIFIGINYTGTANELRGCVNDVKTMVALYKKLYGLTNIMMLTDEPDMPMSKRPTKTNILSAIQWLVTNNAIGEQLFFHYSGHGSQVIDRDYDEKDGYDECIIPCDFETNGFITDDDLHTYLVDKVGDAYLFAAMDSCHSGTGFDLAYTLDSNNIIKRIPGRRSLTPLLNTALLSGCADEQTSADTQEVINGVRKPCGALTWSLQVILNLNKNVTYRELLTNSRIMMAKGYSQIPQLSFNVYPITSDRVIRGDRHVVKQSLV